MAKQVAGTPTPPARGAAPAGKTTTPPAKQPPAIEPETSDAEPDVDPLLGEDDASGADDASPETPEGAAADETVYELSLPDNDDSGLPPEHIEGVVAFAKANKLSPEQAQKTLERDTVVVKGVTAAHQASWKARTDGYLAALRKDPEVGGSKLPASIKLADKALSTYFAPEVRAELSKLGVIRWPALFKGLVKAGAALGESPQLRGDPPPQKKKTRGEKLFAKTHKQLRDMGLENE